MIGQMNGKATHLHLPVGQLLVFVRDGDIAMPWQGMTIQEKSEIISPRQFRRQRFLGTRNFWRTYHSLHGSPPRLETADPTDVRAVSCTIQDAAWTAPLFDPCLTCSLLCTVVGSDPRNRCVGVAAKPVARRTTHLLTAATHVMRLTPTPAFSILEFHLAVSTIGD